MYNMDYLSTIFAIYTFIVFLALAVSLTSTIVYMVYAKKCGARFYGLVWIPIGEGYVAGQLADMYEDKNMRKKLPIISGMLFVLFLILYTLFFLYTYFSSFVFAAIFILIFIVMMALSITLVIFRYIAMYRIFAAKSPGNAAIWLILSILFSTITLLIFMSKYMNTPVIEKQSAMPYPPQDGYYDGYQASAGQQYYGAQQQQNTYAQQDYAPPPNDNDPYGN